MENIPWPGAIFSSSTGYQGDTKTSLNQGALDRWKWDVRECFIRLYAKVHELEQKQVMLREYVNYMQRTGDTKTSYEDFLLSEKVKERMEQAIK